MKILTPHLVASGLLFFALIPDLPYGYFIFLRIVIFFLAGYAALVADEYQSGFLVKVFVVVAILFNPFMKIRLDRDIWQVIDIVCGVLFFVAGCIAAWADRPQKEPSRTSGNHKDLRSNYEKCVLEEKRELLD